MTGRIHDEPLTLAAYAILNEPGDQARNYHQALGLFEHAERLDIEGVWVRQFHLRRPGSGAVTLSGAAPVSGAAPSGTAPEPGGGLPSPFVFLAWLAARTRRLRLGTAAVTLPLESPLRVAEDAAVLDALSGGRTELGVANGGAAPGLAELFRGGATGAGGAGGGSDPGGRRAAYQADLARLSDALGGAALDDAAARLNPPSPGLSERIWEATLTERSGYDTGLRGHGVLIGTTQAVPAEVTARAYLRGLDRYAGRRRPPRLGLATLIYPARDRETALREARAGIEEKYDWGRAFLPPAVTLAEKAASICLHYGTAEQITESIAAQPWFPYATQLMVQTELFYASYAQRADALELFTREVAPALGWAGAASRAVTAGPPGRSQLVPGQLRPADGRAPASRDPYVELDFPLGLARFAPRVGDVSLVAAGEGIATGFIPAIESDLVLAGPVDESLVGTPGVIDVSKRGVSACWQHAGPDPVIAIEFSRRDDTHFEVHRTFHVYDVQAEEERPGRFDVVARQPPVKLG